MRTLTKRERRLIELELKKTGYEQDKTRIIVDSREREGMYLLGLTVMDNDKSQRLCVPFKSEPDINRIIKQLEHLAPVVSEAM